MYYSNEDFENFYVRYKAEGLPRKVCMKEFCIRNKVPWNLFDKWYHDTHHRIVEVKVTGRPQEADNSNKVKAPQARPADKPEEDTKGRPGMETRIMIDIRVSNGLHIRQKNLSYRKLRDMVEKLEDLC